MNKKATACTLAAVAVLVAGPAAAALYRCGNVFQDRPCEAVEQQEVIRPGQAPARPAAAPAAAPASTPRPAAAAAPADAGEAAGAAAAPPSPVCGNLREQHAALKVRLAGAARAETRLVLGRQQRELEKNMAEANCR